MNNTICIENNIIMIKSRFFLNFQDFVVLLKLILSEFLSRCSIVEGRGESHSEQIMAQLPTVLGEKLERLMCNMSV